MLSSLWDQGISVKLKETVKRNLLGRLFSSLEYSGFSKPELWIGHLYIVGSSAGYNYKEDGDLDIDVMYLPEMVKKYNPKMLDNIQERIQDAIRKNKDVKVPGTNLTYSFIAFLEGDPLRSDGVYDILNDKWVKGPIRIPESFDPDIAFSEQKVKAQKVMNGIYTNISDIMIALNDLKRIDQYTNLYDNRLKTKKQAVTITLKMLCLNLATWRRKIWELQEKPDISTAIYPAYNFSPDWNERNIIFKYTARYGGHEPVYYLYNLLEGNSYLSLIKSFMPDDSIGPSLKL
jgi:hypothetical protein